MGMLCVRISCFRAYVPDICISISSFRAYVCPAFIRMSCTPYLISIILQNNEICPHCTMNGGGGAFDLDIPLICLKSDKDV